MLPLFGTVAEIDKLEKVQRRAARFISKDYKSKQKGCVTKMLQEHNLPPLQERRNEIRLALFYKIANGSLPGLPDTEYLTKYADKRLRRGKNSMVTSTQTLSKTTRSDIRSAIYHQLQQVTFTKTLFLLKQQLNGTP